MQRIYTVGHSNHRLERFNELLLMHGIEVLLDVRSAPTSTYSPQFNRAALPRGLPGSIRYAYLGHKLGGRPTLATFYDAGGHVLYGPLSRSADFKHGLELIEAHRATKRIALLCSEADPMCCHRRILIARSFLRRGMDAGDILHILGDGSLRSERELPYTEPMLEELWRSPLSVSRNPAPNRSSDELQGLAYQG